MAKQKKIRIISDPMANVKNGKQKQTPGGESYEKRKSTETGRI